MADEKIMQKNEKSKLYIASDLTKIKRILFDHWKLYVRRKLSAKIDKIQADKFYQALLLKKGLQAFVKNFESNANKRRQRAEEIDDKVLPRP